MESENGTKYGVPCSAIAAPKAMDLELNAGGGDVLGKLIDKMGDVAKSMIYDAEVASCTEGSDCEKFVPLEISAVRLDSSSVLKIQFN